MKVISNLQGKAVALINIDEVLPEQGLHVPDAIPLVVQRYGFVKAPSLSDPLQKARDDGFKFEIGKVTVSGLEHAIQDFVLWPDGLVVTAFTTPGAEAFLDDFLTWGKQALGFRVALTEVTKRLYVSQIVVEFDYSPASKLRSLMPVSNVFHEALQKAYGHDFPPTEIVTMRFDYDHAVAPHAFRNLAQFVIERRENHRFTEGNVFFSQAPLPTEDHIRLLEEFERTLSPNVEESASVRPSPEAPSHDSSKPTRSIKY